jgi:hypothetical protein
MNKLPLGYLQIFVTGDSAIIAIRQGALNHLKLYWVVDFWECILGLI